MNTRCHLDDSFLIELLRQNIEHARHVENERLSFNSIYIAVVAGFFALVIDFEYPFLTIFFIGILLFISMVGLLFTKRWTDIFEEHMDRAKYIAQMLYGDEELDEEDKSLHEETINKYYYFNHNYERHAVKNRIKKAQRKGRVLTYEQAEDELNHFKGPWHKMSRIRTRTLFYMFYAIVIAVLCIFLVFSIIMAVPV